jgi:hypothetical protein
MPKDWLHVEEAIALVNWVLSLCIVDRFSMEKQPFKIIVIPGWILLGFLPYELCYTYTYLYFHHFGNFLECFLSKSTNYMHILAYGPE